MGVGLQNGRAAIARKLTTATAKLWGFLRKPAKSGDFLHFAGANTGRANADPAACALNHRAHALEIHVPASLRDVVCVADPAAELGPAPADFTYSRHKCNSSDGKNLYYISELLCTAISRSRLIGNRVAFSTVFLRAG